MQFFLIASEFQKETEKAYQIILDDLGSDRYYDLTSPSPVRREITPPVYGGLNKDGVPEVISSGRYAKLVWQCELAIYDDKLPPVWPSNVTVKSAESTFNIPMTVRDKPQKEELERKPTLKDVRRETDRRLSELLEAEDEKELNSKVQDLILKSSFLTNKDISTENEETQLKAIQRTTEKYLEIKSIAEKFEAQAKEDALSPDFRDDRNWI